MNKVRITGKAAKAWVTLIFAALVAVNEAAEAQATDGWDWSQDIWPVVSALLLTLAVYIVPNAKDPADEVVVVPVDSESGPVE